MNELITLRDAIHRKFCPEKGVEHVRAVLTEGLRRLDLMFDKKCQCCGNIINYHTDNKKVNIIKYCSQTCRNRSYMQRKAKEMFVLKRSKK